MIGLLQRVRHAHVEAQQSIIAEIGAGLLVLIGIEKDDTVEKAMLALSRPYWREGEIARNCRCGQTVVYVRDIRTLYNNYVRLTRSVKTVSNTPEFSQDI